LASVTGMKHMPTGAFSSVPMTISYSRSDRASQPSACAQDRASPAPAGCLSPSRHRPCQPGDCDPRRGTAPLTTTARPARRARPGGEPAPARRPAGRARPSHPEDTMPVNARPRRTRPSGAPAYYLGRPASVWITATARPAASR